jgi:hypothetical protein
MLNEAIILAPNTPRSGVQRIYGDRRQWHSPIIPRQAPQSYRLDSELLSDLVFGPRPPTLLFGYLAKSPKGQWALVCSLSEKNTWWRKIQAVTTAPQL